MFPGHSTNHRKTIKRVPTIKGVFCDRHKHDSPAGLLKRVFLSPKVSIDETKCTEGQADIRLRPHYLFLLRARGDKDSARRYGISYQQALASNSSIPDQCHVQNCVSAELIVFPEMTDTGYSMSVIQKNADEWNSGFVPGLRETWPFTRDEHFRVLAQARAIENQSYVIASNRVGKDDDLWFCGSSAIIDPRGVVIAAASADREELIYADLSQELVHSVRRRVGSLAHRRQDLY